MTQQQGGRDGGGRDTHLLLLLACLDQADRAAIGPRDGLQFDGKLILNYVSQQSTKVRQSGVALSQGGGGGRCVTDI